MKKISFLLLVLLVVITGCSRVYNTDAKEQRDATTDIVLATTTSTQDSGLLDQWIPTFEKEHAIDVKVVAVGTGQALQMGRDGNADVLLVHAKNAEKQFVKNDYGSYAFDVMYNQFVIVGPESDKAGITQATSAIEAFQLIQKNESVFLSRGDDSGTNKKELNLWKKAGIEKPKGKWYKPVGQGMGATLQMAGEMGAYTLSDEATYLTNKNGLKVLFSGDEALFNPYGVMYVNSSDKEAAAKTFIDFIVGEKGQEIVQNYGEDTYGKTLFVPNASKR